MICTKGRTRHEWKRPRWCWCTHRGGHVECVWCRKTTMRKAVTTALGPRTKPAGPVKSWGLYSKLLGFYTPRDTGVQKLYRTRKEAADARVNECLVMYRVVRVGLQPAVRRCG